MSNYARQVLTAFFVVCTCMFVYYGSILQNNAMHIQSFEQKLLLHENHTDNTTDGLSVLKVYWHFKAIENKLYQSLPENVTINNTFNWGKVKKNIISKYPTIRYKFSDANTPFWNISTPTQTKKKIWAILKIDEKKYARNIAHAKHACYPGRNTSHDPIITKYVCYKLSLEKTQPFSYDIRYAVEPGNIHLTVLESQTGRRTHGGSSFHVQVQAMDTGFMLQCTVQDSFDGRYSIDCPVVFTRECVMIKITREYHDFLGYVEAKKEAPRGSLYKPVIWWQKICGGLKASAGPVYEGWAVKNGFWSWMRSEGLQLPTPVEKMSRQRIHRCISSLSSLTMIGSSHMRYTADYLASKMQQHAGVRSHFEHAIGQRNHYFRFHNFSFLWGNYAEIAAKFIRELRTENKVLKSEKDVVVFQTAAWDFKRGAEYFFNISQVLMQEVKELKLSPLWKKSRVVWMNSIAAPEIRIFGSSARNNIITQAINEHMRRELKGYDIEEVDTFGVSYPRNNAPVKYNHYLCGVDNKGPDFTGDIGKQIAHNLIRTLCPK